MLIKSILDGGWKITNGSWSLTNIFIGAPGQYQAAYFPQGDGFIFIIAKLLSYFTHNYAIILNIIYILTFPAATLSALFVLKQLKMDYPLALSASILFAFLPYHFWRGESHLFLSSYYTIPLAIWMCTTIATTHSFSSKQWGLYSVFCLLIGSSFIYYAFFSSFFIIMAGLIGSLSQHHLIPIKKALLLVFLITLTTILNLAPCFMTLIADHGRNKAVAYRHPAESEMYALKITPMRLPQANDHIQFLAHFRQKYDRTSISQGETGSTTLGLISSIGFMALLSLLLINNRGKASTNHPLILVSKLNIL